MAEITYKDRFLQQLKRAAWKLQYEAKKQYRKEIPLINDDMDMFHIEDIDSLLFVEELLSSLPDRERFIIQKVVIEERTEREVALELHISRSRLHACKVKGLQRLRQKLALA